MRILTALNMCVFAFLSINMVLNVKFEYTSIVCVYDGRIVNILFTQAAILNRPHGNINFLPIAISAKINTQERLLEAVIAEYNFIEI